MQKSVAIAIICFTAKICILSGRALAHRQERSFAHSKFTTTQIYTPVHTNNLRAAIEKNPRIAEEKPDEAATGVIPQTSVPIGSILCAECSKPGCGLNTITAIDRHLGRAAKEQVAQAREMLPGLSKVRSCPGQKPKSERER
jgi:hypothetical protein